MTETPRCPTCFHCALIDIVGADHERCMRIMKGRNGEVLRTMIDANGRRVGTACKYERDSIPEPQRADGDRCGPDGIHWRSRL